jgi:4-alpha-glucanotransferase
LPHGWRQHDPLDQLAAAAGVARSWRDAEHQMHHVEDEVLGAVLGALGYPATSENQQQLSLDRLRKERDTPPSFLSGDAGHPITLPPALAQASHADLYPEQGEPRTLAIHQGQLPPFEQPGYHRLVVEDHALTLALAPSCCPPIAAPGRKRWGVAVQMPSLRDKAGNAYGTLADLPSMIAMLASHGADAVAISPLHALLPGDGQHFSPYSPSSRLFLNGALSCPVEGPRPRV